MSSSKYSYVRESTEEAVSCAISIIKGNSIDREMLCWNAAMSAILAMPIQAIVDPRVEEAMCDPSAMFANQGYFSERAMSHSSLLQALGDFYGVVSSTNTYTLNFGSSLDAKRKLAIAFLSVAARDRLSNPGVYEDVMCSGKISSQMYGILDSAYRGRIGYADNMAAQTLRLPTRAITDMMYGSNVLIDAYGSGIKTRSPLQAICDNAIMGCQSISLISALCDRIDGIVADKAKTLPVPGADPMTDPDTGLVQLPLGNSFSLKGSENERRFRINRELIFINPNVSPDERKAFVMAHPENCTKKAMPCYAALFALSAKGIGGAFGLADAICDCEKRLSAKKRQEERAALVGAILMPGFESSRATLHTMNYESDAIDAVNASWMVRSADKDMKEFAKGVKDPATFVSDCLRYASSDANLTISRWNSYANAYHNETNSHVRMPTIQMFDATPEKNHWKNALKAAIGSSIAQMFARCVGVKALASDPSFSDAAIGQYSTQAIRDFGDRSKEQLSLEAAIVSGNSAPERKVYGFAEGTSEEDIHALISAVISSRQRISDRYTANAVERYSSCKYGKGDREPFSRMSWAANRVLQPILDIADAADMREGAHAPFSLSSKEMSGLADDLASCFVIPEALEKIIFPDGPHTQTAGSVFSSYGTSTEYFDWIVQYCSLAKRSDIGVDAAVSMLAERMSAPGRTRFLAVMASDPGVIGSDSSIGSLEGFSFKERKSSMTEALAEVAEDMFPNLKSHYTESHEIGLDAANAASSIFCAQFMADPGSFSWQFASMLGFIKNRFSAASNQTVNGKCLFWQGNALRHSRDFASYCVKDPLKVCFYHRFGEDDIRKALKNADDAAYIESSI